MTEAEWLACQDVAALLAFAGPAAGERKQRLFGCACVRRVWDLLGEPSRGAVSALEQYADGHCTRDEVERAFTVALEPLRTGVADCAASRAAHAAYWLRPVSSDLFRDNLSAAVLYCAQARNYASHRRISQKADTARQGELLRHILGNPFRPIALDPAWLTANVVGLAQSIYDERAFDRLPILADALEDAGCDNADILNHCRLPAEHVRGCWLVDLLLDKA